MSFRSENQEFERSGRRPLTDEEARSWPSAFKVLSVLDTANGEILSGWLLNYRTTVSHCTVLLRGSRAEIPFLLRDGEAVKALVDERWLVLVTPEPWPEEPEDEVQEDMSLFDALTASVEIEKLRAHLQTQPSRSEMDKVWAAIAGLEEAVGTLQQTLHPVR